MWGPIHSGAALVGRATLAGILGWSGLEKLRVPVEEVSLAIEAYQLLPLNAALAMARVLPWVEVAVAAFLLVGLFLRPAALGAVGLHLLFIGALSSALIRKIPLENCGCFGPGGPHMTPGQALGLDVVCVALALLIFFDRAQRGSLDRLFSGGKTSPPAPAR